VIIIMRPEALQIEVDGVVRRLGEHDCEAHVSAGTTQTVVGVVGDTRAVFQAASWERLPGVEKVVRVMESYKLVSRKFQPESTVITVRGVTIGDGSFTPIAGPCAVESRDQLFRTAEAVKKAATLFRASDLNYGGFIEGDEIFTGHADVVVCDGFVGNVVTKASEGLAKMISQFMKQAFMRNIFTRLAGVVALPVINAFRKSVDTRRYNGASLVGLNGIVVKSHGGADAVAFEYAILVALAEIQKQVPQLIGQRLASMHAPGELA